VHRQVLTNENVVGLKCPDAKIAPQPVSSDHGRQAIYQGLVRGRNTVPVPYWSNAICGTSRMSRRADKVVEMVGPGAAMGDGGRAEYCCPIISRRDEWGALLVSSS